MKRNRISAVGVAGLVLSAFVLSGCGSSTGPDADSDNVCRPAGDPAFYACARLGVSLDVIPEPWPSLYRWSIRTIAANPRLNDETHFRDPDGNEVRLDLPLWVPLDHLPGDTASVWVVVKLLDDPRPIVTGVPLPVFAEDSVLHVARFVGAGERLLVDTLFLSLAEPQAGMTGLLARFKKSDLK
ncbi:MAG: hypothetical protein HKO65_14630 [Gemmatimonadetes bacterium]|nr:hypothetical protein [Gemmatimonadota bacterium]NNM06324.1 hypothetical protein [Gemmatimonadota bacterium]